MVQVRVGKWLTDLEKNFYGSSMAYDQVWTCCKVLFASFLLPPVDDCLGLGLRWMQHYVGLQICA